MEPVGLGTPGSYVARVASRVYAQEERGTLSDQGERSDGKTSRYKSDEELEVNSVSASGKGLSLQASVCNAARYCVLKILNTSRRHLEIGKNVKLGTAEAILRCASRVTGFNSRNTEAGGTSNSIVNVIRENNSSEFGRRIAHLAIEDKQNLMPFVDNYMDLFCNDKEGVLPCTTKGYHEIRTGDALTVKKNPYRVPYALRGDEESIGRNNEEFSHYSLSVAVGS